MRRPHIPVKTPLAGCFRTSSEGRASSQRQPTGGTHADAVRQASALTGEAVDELTAVLGRLRQNLDGHWDEGEENDTERLRVALRGYGSLIEHILTR